MFAKTMSADLNTKSLTAAVAESLAWLSDVGFRYSKSKKDFGRRNDNGFSYIAVNVVTHNRIDYDLAFYLGVQITEVEAWLLKLTGDTRPLSRHDLTIWNYTVNIGPSSPHWRFPIRGIWSVSKLEGFNSISKEVNRFIRELAIPFVDEQRDPLVLRRTLIETPGHATNIWPYQQILAIDCLYGSPEQLQADFALLDRRYESYSPGPRQEFDKFVATVKKATNGEQAAAPNAAPPHR